MITTGDLYFRNILKPKYTIQVQFDNQISKLHNCREILKKQNQKLTQLQSLLLSRLADLTRIIGTKEFFLSEESD